MLVVTAMKSADENCGLAHRDISLGNVMIRVMDGSAFGVLTDWDHAGPIEPTNDPDEQVLRVVCTS